MDRPFDPKNPKPFDPKNVIVSKDFLESDNRSSRHRREMKQARTEERVQRDKDAEASGLKKLQREWYAKLKKSGFEDIETKNGTLANTTHSGGSLDKRRVTWQSQEEYYRLARYFLHDYKFKKPIHQVIWEYHSEGISVRDIVKLLNKVRRKKTDRQTVWELINEFATEMKKMYGIIDGEKT